MGVELKVGDYYTVYAVEAQDDDGNIGLNEGSPVRILAIETAFVCLEWLRQPGPYDTHRTSWESKSIFRDVTDEQMACVAHPYSGSRYWWVNDITNANKDELLSLMDMWYRLDKTYGKLSFEDRRNVMADAPCDVYVVPRETKAHRFEGGLRSDLTSAVIE